MAKSLAKVVSAFAYLISSPLGTFRRKATRITASEFLQEQMTDYTQQLAALPDADDEAKLNRLAQHRAVSDFCQVLLNSAEFLYVD